MPDESNDDLTKPLTGPDAKFGKFEADPRDKFVVRYRPSATELKRLESWLKEEYDRAWQDDIPRRERKLALLDSYRALPNSEKSIIEMPLIKRAVKQNVAWTVDTIMSHRPLVTVTPYSNSSITVLVEDRDYGSIPLERSSEEVSASLELFLDYKLRRCLNFRRVVKDAALEAKRGQTPTWIKVCHDPKKEIARTPVFEQQGAGITFSSKEDSEVQYEEATTLENVSTYSMLMPADEQDPQKARALWEEKPFSPEDLRALFESEECFLVEKNEYEDIVKNGLEAELPPATQRKAVAESRVPQKVRPWHKLTLAWFYWTVPMRTMTLGDGMTKPTVKTEKKRYSMVGWFHPHLGRLFSCTRIPFDMAKRPYTAIYDWKEPFRNDDQSLAEDNRPTQRAMSDMLSLEIKGAVNATTPVGFAEPGSMAGEWLSDHQAEPGDIIPRMRPEEIEFTTLGQRPYSLLPAIEFEHGQYEKNNSLSDLNLGLNVTSHTTSSGVAQVLSQGETQAQFFLEDFRNDLSDAIKMYIQVYQQYSRGGEVIPFDPETAAMIKAALEDESASESAGMPTEVPVRFPKAPIQKQFAFDIAASSDDRTKQNDFQQLLAMKNVIDGDGAKFAQIAAILPQLITEVAAGNAPKELLQAIAQDCDRNELIVELLGKAMRRDGQRFAISRNLMRTLVNNTLAKEQEMLRQRQQGAQSGATPNQAGTQLPTGGGNPSTPPGVGGELGGVVQQPGMPQPPLFNQETAAPPFGVQAG